MDVSKSLFSLVNTSQGFFKSEKQASFLISQSVNGVVYANQTLAFGEFGGCKRVITFEFVLDSEGVQAVYKVNSKKERFTYWKREESYIQAVEAKQAFKQAKQQKADEINAVRKSLDRVDAFNKVLLNELYEICLIVKPEDMATNKEIFKLNNRMKHVKAYKAVKEAKHTKLLNEF